MIRKIAFAATGAALVCAAAYPLPAPEQAVVSVAREAIVASYTPAGGVATTAAAACVDTAYAFQPWHLTSTYKWYYNGTRAPASVAAAALTTLRTASKSAASGRNRCGTTVTLSTTEQYLGTTNAVAQISATGACLGNDGVSVASWGTLPPSVLAVTCAYYRTSTGAVSSSDLLIDNTVHKWFTTLPANCANAFDLESVVMHERGHTAGLAHVDQATHAVETMSPKAVPCDTAKRAFAAGDLRGLAILYSR